MTDSVNVVDNTETSRFEAAVGGHCAELLYDLDGDRLVLVHTGVPEEIGGRGSAGTSCTPPSTA